MYAQGDRLFKKEDKEATVRAKEHCTVMRVSRVVQRGKKKRRLSSGPFEDAHERSSLSRTLKTTVFCSHSKGHSSVKSVKTPRPRIA